MYCYQLTFFKDAAGNQFVPDWGMTFRQAFTIMPKNPSIALNLLQAAAINLREANSEAAKDTLSTQLIHNCLKAIESGKLTEEQEQRYQRVKKVLKDLT